MSDDQTEVGNQATSASPAEELDSGTHEAGEALEGSQPQPAEEGAVGSAAQHRIRKLSADKRKATQEAAYWREVARRYAEADRSALAASTQPGMAAVPQTAAQTYPKEEVERAFSTLRAEGMATREDLNDALLRIEWDRMHDRNEAEINRRGSNMPHYDRNEVEDYARQTGIADPMRAYRELYFDEIVDSARRGDYKPSGTKMTTQRPTKAPDISREPLSLESFRSKLQGDAGKEYYERLKANPEEFDRVMRQLAEQG